MVRIDSFIDKTTNRIYYFPTPTQIKTLNLSIIEDDHDIYLSETKAYYYFHSANQFIEMNETPSILDNFGFKSLIKRLIKNEGIEASDILFKSNNLSKNILSPYMRIIYHLIKLSSESTTNKMDMKKHTNIIRSIIPYEILMLIAINAMYFYKSFDESRNELRRWGDLFKESENDNYLEVFNDYRKYFKLLIKCDFFEYLNMDFTGVKKKLANLHLNIDLSSLNPLSFNSGKMVYSTGKDKTFIAIDGDTEFSCRDLYKIFHQKLLEIETDVLILFFYFDDTTIDITKNKIMDKILTCNREKARNAILKNKHLNLFYSNNSFILKKHKKIIISRDFLDLYSKGELPAII